MTSWKKEGDVVVQLVVNPRPEGVFDVKACVTGEPPVPASLHPPPREQPEARATADLHPESHRASSFIMCCCYLGTSVQRSHLAFTMKLCLNRADF